MPQTQQLVAAVVVEPVQRAVVALEVDHQGAGYSGGGGAGAAGVATSGNGASAVALSGGGAWCF